MSEWKKVKFLDLFSEPTKNGIYKSKEFHGRGAKIINMGEVFAYSFIGNQEMSRVEINDKERNSFLVKNGDLLFARRSLVESGAGKCAIANGITEETTFESSIIRVRLNENNAIPLFYMYWMRSLSGRTAINGIVNGVNVKGIRATDLQNIEVELPPMEIQHRIATILSRYDSLIENYQKQIKLLEEAAQRLYKEWFVDLHFPGHENTKIVDGVPEGWEKTNVNNILTFHRGYDLTHKEFVDGPYPVVGSTSIIGNHNKYKVEGPGVVTGRSGSLGVYQLIWDNFWPHNTSLYISDFKGHNVFYIYCLLKTVDFKTLNSGGAIPSLNRNTLSSIHVMEPSISLQDKFSEKVMPMFKRQRHLLSQIRLLTEACDRLLPKLMSGEIEI
jgi:type I restriction enzyme S subunit